MKEKEYYIEEDRIDEVRFFEQSASAHTVSAVAHIHDAVEMIYVIKGSYSVLLNGEQYHITQGDMILFCSGVIHHIVSEEQEENSYYVLKINPSILWELSPTGQGTQYVLQFAHNRGERKCFWTKAELEDTPLLQTIQKLIKEARCGGYASELAMRIYAVELLLSVLRSDVAKEKNELLQDETAHRIYDIMIYMREHYAEEINERMLARKMGMSYSYFSRTFRRVIGQSFRAYLNTIRVDQAERALLTTSKSVSEIALDCGYNSLSYFISVYRAIKGETPRSTLTRQK